MSFWETDEELLAYHAQLAQETAQALIRDAKELAYRASIERELLRIAADPGLSQEEKRSRSWRLVEMKDRPDETASSD